MPKMNPEKMSEDRIRELIQSYGANSDRWPETERLAGKTWLTTHSPEAQKLIADAHDLDQMLDTAYHPATDTSLLQARILKAAQNIPQENIPQDSAPGLVAANDVTKTYTRKANALTSWKSVAATLMLTTGLGFGIGQVAAADTSYASAEALLSISTQSGYDEADLYGDLSGDGS